MKTVIVGGVAGGAAAAARIRRLDETAEILILERSGHISYANCGLPYYIGGEIEERKDLTLQTPRSFARRFRIEARVRHEVLSVDPGGKTVTVRDLEKGEIYTESYDKLLLATGAEPMGKNLPGADSRRLFSLRTVEDAATIRSFIEEEHPKTALIVGGGFIGLEMAENLARRGMEVTLIQAMDRLFPPLDRDMSAMLQHYLRQKKIRILLNAMAEGFEEDGGQIRVLIRDRDAVTADMAVMAIGVAPDTTLARQIGLETGIKNSILVNDRMETSVKDIYAVGDAVEVRHRVTEEPALISMAGPANRQGRIAADNICGGDSRYGGSMGSSVMKVFDMTVALTGINEETAKARGIEYEVLILSPQSHASYYPGAKVMTVKILYEKKTLKILGGAILGFEGVDKRMDVLATAMFAGLKVTDLKDLELTYAPPYSSVRDPLNIAGYMAENIEEGLVKQYRGEEMASVLKKDATRLDVRTEAEYGRGHIDGFDPVPLDDLRERLSEIDRNRPVYVLCQSGLRSYLACRILAQNGFDCAHLAGGYRFYETVEREYTLAETALPCVAEIE